MKVLAPGSWQVVAKVEAPGSPTGEPPLAAADRPSGDDLREGRDVILGVAAVYAQGVAVREFRAPGSR